MLTENYCQRDGVMKQRKEVVEFCLGFENTYEDYPFSDPNWTIMRHCGNRKMFAAIYNRMGNIWVNVKCDPCFAHIWRSKYEAVVPAYHMNKYHWNSIILDGSICVNDIKSMIFDSFELTKPKKRKGKMYDKAGDI